MALEVLVVDDEADIRELVSGVLEDEGYAVRTAADSTQTLEAVEERRPSMVLLDVWLQGSKLDGLQLHGSSVAINTVRATLKRVAPTGSRVLISGPPGVGKEIAARMIHQWSPRARAPFIVLSAAMMSPERVEEELFGTEGDGAMRPGLLEHAHGGTLFLDEIADMPLTTQAKILRVLTDQSY